MCNRLLNQTARAIHGFRDRHGERTYRSRIGQLKPQTHDTLCMIAGGMSGRDIVEKIAFRDFHSDPRVSFPTERELLSAAMKFVDQVHEIHEMLK